MRYPVWATVELLLGAVPVKATGTGSGRRTTGKQELERHRGGGVWALEAELRLQWSGTPRRRLGGFPS